MHHALRAFNHPNYRTYFAGQSVALIGMWVQQIAGSWLVYRLTGSALLLGITGFAGQIAIFFLAPFGGIWADRFDRCKTLIFTQIATVALSLALAWVTWAGGANVNVWHVITLAMLLGIVQALETPVRSSYTPELVTLKTDLPSAIAFGGGMQNAGRMIGPTIAGLMLAYFSEAFCFAMNAVTKLWLIGSLLMIGAAPRLIAKPTENVWASIADGARYTWSLKPLRYLLPMMALMSFAITPYQALMPIFAAEIFAGGASMFGFLVGAAGVGGFHTPTRKADLSGVRREMIRALGEQQIDLPVALDHQRQHGGRAQHHAFGYLAHVLIGRIGRGRRQAQPRDDFGGAHW